MNRSTISRRSFFQVAGASSLGVMARPHSLLAAGSSTEKASPEVARESRDALSIPPKKFDPLGVFLANHGGSTGIQYWPIERWQTEIRNVKRMGGRCVWYLPMEFGQRKEQDFEDNAPYWRLQRDIAKAIADEGLSVGIYLGLNDIFGDTAGAHPAWKAKEGKYFQEEGEVCPSQPAALAEIFRVRAKLFSGLARVDYVITPVTDYGGCSCEKCAPYPLTYLKIFEQQAALCRRFHPQARIVAAGHTLALNEEDMLRAHLRNAEWANFVADIPRGSKPIIKYYMNPEITMVNGWGAYGPCPALGIIRQTYREDYPHVTGAVPYSEGIHDDINRFAVMRYAENPNLSIADVARQYAEEWLGLKGSNASRIAEVIEGLGAEAGTDRAYFWTEYGLTKSNNDDRVKALIDVRAANPALQDNYRFWLLHYRALCESFSVPTGPLSTEVLVAEAEAARQAFLRLEPEYGRFVVGHHVSLLPGRSLWTWPRTFRTAWNRENGFLNAQ